MPTWMNKENVTLVIAVLAFILSTISWVNTLVSNRKKLRISISSYKMIASDASLFYLSIENLSRLPISISRIFLVDGESKYECSCVPQKVLEHTTRSGNVVTEHAVFRNLAVPISLTSLGGIHGYVYFPVSSANSLVPPAELTFLLHTNRGRPIELKSLLNQQAFEAELS